MMTFGALLSVTTAHNSHPTVLHGWSRQGEFESSEESVMATTTMPTVDNLMISPRLWLESHEAENPNNGAYTVLRCDLSMNACQVWGRDFHLERLCQSYSSLVGGTTPVDQDVLDRAIGRSDLLIQTLLAEALEILRNAPLRGDEVYIMMLTLLWEQPSDGKNHIVVKGHLFSSQIPSIPLQYNPAPMSASIALPSNTGTHLPNRYKNLPSAKLSAWCRMRRPLEGVFKVDGMDEVLLTRPHGNDVQLLEGLTSNVFVICKDGTLRTPDDDGVLGGYARHLVLEAARQLGFPVEVGPLCMSELGSWDHMFCTSAIRLVIPVGQLWIPESNYIEGIPTQLTSVWAANAEEQPGRTWRAIYHEILNIHPYYYVQDHI